MKVTTHTLRAIGFLAIVVALGSAGCASLLPRWPLRSAVEVVCADTGQVRGTGTLIRDGRQIVTALHVVRECGGRMQIQNEEIGAVAVKLRRVDVIGDLALLESASPLPGGVGLGDFGDLQVGDAVRVVGFPWCSVCDTGRSIRIDRDAQLAALDRDRLVLIGSFGVGDSGAPVVWRGELVGLVVAKPMVELPDWWIGQRIRVPTQDGLGVAADVRALRALIEYGEGESDEK